MNRLRDILWRWAPALAVMALIFVLSDQPGLAFSDDKAVDAPLRRVAHLAIYALLSVCLASGLRAGRSVVILLAAAVLAVVYGMTDEIHQSFVADRSGNPTDVIVDGIGALIGVAVFVLLPRARFGRET